MGYEVGRRSVLGGLCWALSKRNPTKKPFDPLCVPESLQVILSVYGFVEIRRSVLYMEINTAREVWKLRSSGHRVRAEWEDQAASRARDIIILASPQGSAPNIIPSMPSFRPRELGPPAQ